MTDVEQELGSIEPGQRVLLLPHCLRPANVCRGKYSKRGLECDGCQPECVVSRLREAAVKLGYKGVCIAPGGKLAIRYIEQNQPLGIVAVACDKELREGVQGINATFHEGRKAIPIVVVPLSKDGCVDTEVDVSVALEKIALGCGMPVTGKA